MFDLMHLIISTASAADAPTVAAATDAATTAVGAGGPPPMAEGNMLMKFLPVFLILGVFYFLLIRPQQKKFKEQENMLKAIKVGDKVVTGGGIIGTVAKLDGEDKLMVEIADGIRVKVVRSTVVGLDQDAQSAKNDNAKSDAGHQKSKKG